MVHRGRQLLYNNSQSAWTRLLRAFDPSFTHYDPCTKAVHSYSIPVLHVSVMSGFLIKLFSGACRHTDLMLFLHLGCARTQASRQSVVGDYRHHR